VSTTDPTPPTLRLTLTDPTKEYNVTDKDPNKYLKHVSNNSLATGNESKSPEAPNPPYSLAKSNAWLSVWTYSKVWSTYPCDSVFNPPSKSYKESYDIFHEDPLKFSTGNKGFSPPNTHLMKFNVVLDTFIS